MAFSAPELEVDPDELARRLAAGEVELVDVREPYEWEAGRIEGARHVELERLASQAETIARDRPVVFACRLGARSAMAAQAFRAAGWDAWSLRGGLTLWHDQGLPIVPEGAYVADH
jgi:hydroxyacylglutathione hydrolase/adenylyltransferase/sulfurtransferase